MRSILAIAALAAAAPAFATSYDQPMGIEELADDAARAVVGEVLGTRTENVRGSGWWTVATVLVESTLHGPSAAVVEVRWPGGAMGDRELIVAGAPRFRTGDEVLAFIRSDGAVVGMAQGAFSISGDMAIRDLDGIHFQGDDEGVEVFSIEDIRAALR